MEILCFGSGNCFENFLKKYEKEFELLYVIDNDVNKKGTKKNKYIIITPDDIKGITYDYIVVTVFHYTEIVEQLLSMNIEKNRIKIFIEDTEEILTLSDIWESYRKRLDIIEKVKESLLWESSHYDEYQEDEIAVLSNEKDFLIVKRFFETNFKNKTVNKLDDIQNCVCNNNIKYIVCIRNFADAVKNLRMHNISQKQIIVLPFLYIDRTIKLKE